MWVYSGCVPWTEYVWWVMRYPNIYVAWFALCSDPRKWLVKGARYRLIWSVVANEDVHVLIVWLLGTGHVWCFLDSSSYVLTSFTLARGSVVCFCINISVQCGSEWVKEKGRSEGRDGVGERRGGMGERMCCGEG